MKIFISYPPLEGPGSAMLTQNRQFQWYNEPSYIYPVVSAMAATLLKNDGFEVIWNDCIAEKWTIDAFYEFIAKEKPDIIAFESKTPVIKQHWDIIRKIRALDCHALRARNDNGEDCFVGKNVSTKPPRNDGAWIPAFAGMTGAHNNIVTILMGDHVTALPEESMENCPVDFVITGGDYDTLLVNIARHLRDGTELDNGIWYREASEIKNTGEFELKQDLNELPFIDRELTKAHLYGEKWKRRMPFFYTMAGRDCSWGKCSFCSWCGLYPSPRVRKPDNLLDEIETLIKDHGAKEIFDDMGTFPSGEWLNTFCKGMIERGLNKEILFSCNMRFGSLSQKDIELMKEAGFRKLKMGLESASQVTLDRINKGVCVDKIMQEAQDISKQGMKIHLTVMVGYPWETKEDALKTLAFAKEMMQKGYIEMLQSTVVVPYPGTAIHKEALSNGWFAINPEDYNKYDMSSPILNLPDLAPGELMGICKGIYKSFFTPAFIFRNITNVRSLGDIGYIILALYIPVKLKANLAVVH